MAEGKQIALWVGVGCGIAGLIAVISVVLCVGVCAGGVYVASAMPVQESEAFLADLRGNNVDAAYRRMSETYRQTHDLEAFRAAVGRFPALTQQTGASFLQRNISHAGVPRAQLGGQLSTPSGQIPIQVQLSQTGQAWVIDAVAVQGVALQ